MTIVISRIGTDTKAQNQSPRTKMQPLITPGVPPISIRRHYFHILTVTSPSSKASSKHSSSCLFRFIPLQLTERLSKKSMKKLSTLEAAGKPRTQSSAQKKPSLFLPKNKNPLLNVC